jgi:hypothetical protein
MKNKISKTRYLVLQIDIGGGTQWGNPNTINPIREVFIPSVKQYCKKHDYDHLLIQESQYEKQYGQFDFLATKTKHYSFERYFHFDNKYDYTIYIDNDVFVYPDAKPLPEFTGMCNVREPESNSSKIFREENNLSSSFPYFNSGVTFCDNFTAKKLSEYMLNRLQKNIRAKGKNSDNMLLNEFILQNNKLSSEIGCEWNYMPFLENSTKTNTPNFFHFVGIVGKHIINKLQEKNIRIESFLSELIKDKS